MEDLVHKGHRKRMRRKFADFGAIVFDTYELLEMLLYYTVPVKDTNPLAKKLLQEFGSLDGVLSASKEDLMKVEGIGAKTAELIVTAGGALDFFASEEGEKSASVFENYDYLGAYVVNYLADTMDNVQILLTFDNDMRLLGIDEMYRCDYSSGNVKSEKYMDVALKKGATVAIIAHSHPYGPLCPTDGDRVTNSMIQTALSNVGVLLAEHYIVCGKRYIGFMNHLDYLFAQKPRLAKFLRSKQESINANR